MHYFWFLPVFAVLAILTWVLYLVVARGLPKTSDRSVSDAQALEREEDEKVRSGLTVVTFRTVRLAPSGISAAM